jgi:predicted Zn-dependent protease
MNAGAQKKVLKHNLDCFKESNEMISPGMPTPSEIGEIFTSHVLVSMEEELQLGEKSYEEINAKYKILTSGEKYRNISQILKTLVAQISKFGNPAKNAKFGKYSSHYKIYLLESEEINAFTAGARIYVTTGIYNFCQSKDELACIIGHEIAHNELGHLDQKIKEEKTTKLLWGWTGIEDLFYLAAILINLPFNQLNEGHSDLFGTDLVNAAGYNPCAVVSLWERMQKKSGDKNFLDMLSTHPYSGDRANCTGRYLKSRMLRSCRN